MATNRDERTKQWRPVGRRRNADFNTGALPRLQHLRFLVNQLFRKPQERAAGVDLCFPFSHHEQNENIRRLSVRSVR
jgi:hypothetical protein